MHYYSYIKIQMKFINTTKKKIWMIKILLGNTKATCPLAVQTLKNFADINKF